jgi:uncharacterized membrane protein
MKNRRYSMSIAATLALALFTLATWCEAAYYVSDIEFNELLTWDKMLPALKAVRLSHIERLGGIALPMESIAVAGMLAFIGIGLAPRWRPPTWAIASYIALLLIAGGWMGIITLLFCTLQPLDGEFLAEGVARMSACGVWVVVLMVYLGCRISKHRKNTDPNIEQGSTEGATSAEPSM